jgi:biopolymer transport protein ExbD
VSARTSSLLGYGLYFIDVLACLLFCLTLALVSARFGREQSAQVDLPRAPAGPRAGADLTGTSIALLSEQGETRLYLEEQLVSLEELAERLRARPPASVVVRSEATPLARVIAVVHAAGVSEIALAYETEGEPR